MLYLILRLIQSALGQKAEAKPAGRSCRERSQGWAAMLSRDVACLPGGAGLPLGQYCGRVSPFRTKSGFPAIAGSLVAAQAVSGAPTVLVLPAITFCIWNIRCTGEVPRCPSSKDWVSSGYKPHAKGQGHAPVAGTGSPRPRLWGCQQRQSRCHRPGSARAPHTERQNLRVPSGAGGFMGSVSSAIKASKWPGESSSRQLVVNAKKRSPTACSTPAAVRPH